jgi:membrane protein DedA with SNARE-associated domain
MGPQDVAHWVEHYSYFAVVLLCWLCGVGAPLSEDVVILLGGALVAKGRAVFSLMALSAFVGQLGGDFLLYTMGRHFGTRALRFPLIRRLITPERLARVSERFKRQGSGWVMAARFLPGLRAPTFLVAGISHFPRGRFVWLDAVAASVCAPLVTYLGFRFGLAVLGVFHRTSSTVLIGVALGLLLLWSARRWRSARALHRAVP